MMEESIKKCVFCDLNSAFLVYFTSLELFALSEFKLDSVQQLSLFLGI